MLPDRNPSPRPAATLRATVEVVATASGDGSIAVGAPRGDGWVRLADLVGEPGVLDEWWHLVLDGDAGGLPDVAGAFLGAWLADAIATPVCSAVVELGRGWPLDPGRYHLHRSPEGWVDGIVLDDGRLWCLPGDGAVDGSGGVEVVDDRADLHHRVVATLAPVLQQLFTAIRHRAPYGRRGMWGVAADLLAARIVARATTDADRHHRWGEVTGLVDALAGAAGARFTHPRLRVVPWSGGRRPVPVRSTCCLWYKTQDGADPCGEGYCDSCPLRPDDVTDRRLGAWLEAVAEREREQEQEQGRALVAVAPPEAPVDPATSAAAATPAAPTPEPTAASAAP